MKDPLMLLSGFLGGGGVLTIATSTHGLDLASNLVALAGVLGAFGVLTTQIWSVMSGVNDRTIKILDEVQKERNDLRSRVDQLEKQAEAWESWDSERAELDDLRKSSESQDLAIEELETRLIQVSLERDEYERLWRDATKPGGGDDGGNGPQKG